MNNQFRALRKAKNLTQPEFGSRLGVSRDTIANIENNRLVPSESLIKLTAFEFVASESWLRTGEGEMFEQASDDLIEEMAGKYNLGLGGRTLLKAFLGLDSDTREKIFDQLLKEIQALPSKDESPTVFVRPAAARGGGLTHVTRTPVELEAIRKAKPIDDPAL